MKQFFPRIFAAKLCMLVVLIPLFIPAAVAGAFYTSSGGLYGSGFATMESAAYWGWKNSIQFTYAKEYNLSYGGYVYWKTFAEGSPPVSGYTNYWWALITNGGPPSAYYAIGWQPDDSTVSKDIGVSNCSLQQTDPPEGNTVQFSRGINFQVDSDTTSAGAGPTFQRIYNSGSDVESGPLGDQWHHNYESRIIKYPNDTIDFATVQRPDGKAYIYTRRNGQWSSDADVREELTSLIDGSGTFSGWQLVSADGLTTETYTATGQLQTVKATGGLTTDLVYNADHQLSTVTDSLGRRLAFTYDSSRRISNLLTTSGSAYRYTYDSMNRLSSVIRPDSKIRQYFYEQPTLPFALTGIADERGVRSATWAYDAQGRVISNSQGAGTELMSYSSDGATTVTNPLGKNTTYRYQSILGIKHLTAIEGAPSENCPLSNSSYTYDGLGNALTKTDAKGIVTAYTYNDRGLEISRTEASGTSLAKITTTEWDPVRFLRTQVVEPAQTTLYTYDDQGRQLGQQIIVN